ncbi:MAG: S26 family signal peptidase [Lactobacillales bacterium]|nr:S26 family signal peptidase [Lactobacillales bacterium]
MIILIVHSISELHFAKETLTKGLELEINVVTSSMYPTIKAQSLVKSISKKKRKIKTGDIIVFRQIYGQSIMVHRCMFIITLKKKIYITKADSSFLFDQPVSEPVNLSP